MGGYDFVGSNSSADLHALTNWIPEAILLNSHDYRSERSWQDIYSGFSQGNCLVSVGTNEANPDAIKKVGLVPFHNYAVIDIQEDKKGLRLVTLYNAWNTLEPQPATQPLCIADLSLSSPNISSHLTSERVGTFTVSWESLQVYFETIYLNWNPRLFKFNHLVHFFHNPLPAFQVKFGKESPLDSEPEVWILLTRHYENQVIDSKRFMSMQVFLDDESEATSFNRLTSNYDPPPVAATPLSNSIHLLTRFKISKSNLNYAINFTFHQDWTQEESNVSNSARPMGLSLRIYSQVTINLRDSTPIPLANSTELEGEWTPKTAGGNHSLGTYGDNPMWRITINSKQKSDEDEVVKFSASLTSFNPNGTLDSAKPINLKLIRSPGDGRVYHVQQRDLVADSGDYRLGGVRLWANQLLPGKYTLVPSIYEAGKIGKFKLKLEYNLPTSLIKIELIPQEGDGMFKRFGQFNWNNQNQNNYSSCWCINGGKGLVKLKIRLQINPSPNQYCIKLTLLQHHTNDQDQKKEEGGKTISSTMTTNETNGATLGPLQISFPNNNSVRYRILVQVMGQFRCPLSPLDGYSLAIFLDQPCSFFLLSSS